MTTHLKDLQCKPFSWFLKNVYPEKFILDDPKHVFAYGRLKNPTSNTCLDNLQVSLLKWLTILYLYHSPWTLCRTTTRTLTTWANMLVTTSWPVRSSSHSPRSEIIWIVVIWFRTLLLWGMSTGKQTKTSTCDVKVRAASRRQLRPSVRSVPTTTWEGADPIWHSHIVHHLSRYQQSISTCWQSFSVLTLLVIFVSISSLSQFFW